MLLKYGAKVNLQEFNGAAPLHFGCWNGSVEVCTALLDAGADINLKDQYGRTPLYYSVQHKHPEIVKLLLSRHADPSIQTCNGITPETQANQDGNIELIEIFQKYSKEQEKLETEGDNDVNQFEKNFTSEHTKLKAAINKMVEGRDRQVEEMNNIREKLNEHDYILSIVRDNMNQTLDQLNGIEQILKEVMITVNAMIDGNQAGSVRSIPILATCKICKANQATMRCKVCRSPICNKCMIIVKNKGCPFCQAKSVKPDK